MFVVPFPGHRPTEQDRGPRAFAIHGDIECRRIAFKATGEDDSKLEHEAVDEEMWGDFREDFFVVVGEEVLVEWDGGFLLMVAFAFGHPDTHWGMVV